jgi:cytochrome c oxidase subunit 1
MSFTEKTVFMVGTLAAVPASSMHVFNWIATMWGGRIKFAAPMLFGVDGILLFFASAYLCMLFRSALLFMASN